MKIGILSDIHGNADALQRVLEEANYCEVERLYILGDCVGYYYHPDKVLSLLKNWEHQMIKGNHEELLGSIINGTVRMDSVKSKYGHGHQSAIDKLTAEQIGNLINLPEFLRVTVDNTILGLYHGSAFDKDYYLYPDTDIDILRRNENGCDFVFTGHSHYPFIHAMSHGTLINVGSVGQSRVSGGMASWCILNTGNRSVEMRTTVYDSGPLQGEAKRVDAAVPYLAEVLSRAPSKSVRIG